MRWFRNQKLKFQYKVYTVVKIAGHTLQVFEDASKLPTHRMLSYMTRMKMQEWGLSSTNLDIFHDNLETYLSKGQIEEARELNKYVKSLRQMYTTIDNCINLADCFIILDDENIDQCSEEYLARKKELCEGNEQVLDFFLTTALPLIKLTSEFPKDLDLLVYLKDTNRYTLEKNLLRLISPIRFKIFSPPSTSSLSRSVKQT